MTDFSTFDVADYLDNEGRWPQDEPKAPRASPLVERGQYPHAQPTYACHAIRPKLLISSG